MALKDEDFLKEIAGKGFYGLSKVTDQVVDLVVCIDAINSKNTDKKSVTDFWDKNRTYILGLEKGFKDYYIVSVPVLENDQEVYDILNIKDPKMVNIIFDKDNLNINICYCEEIVYTINIIEIVTYSGLLANKAEYYLVIKFLWLVDLEEEFKKIDNEVGV